MPVEKRREQRLALRNVAGTWKDEDYPELAQRSVGWVRRMREECEVRFQEIEPLRAS